MDANKLAKRGWEAVRRDPKRWTAYPVGALWMYWASKHFLAAELAVLQMPGSERLGREPTPSILLLLFQAGIATTGIFEVLFAVMVFFTRWRRLAAMGQMALLVVFLPLLVFMMVNVKAIHTIFPSCY